MDADSAATIIPRTWAGVRALKVSCQQDMTLCSFDTETFYASVFAFGFCHPDGEVEINHGLKKDHISFFLDRLRAVPSRAGSTIVCGAHYMLFDLGVLFWRTVAPLNPSSDRAPRQMNFSMLSHRAEIEFFMSRPCFARIRMDGRTYHLIDTYSFFPMGLKKALKMLKCETQKKEKPSQLGKRIIPLSELRPYLSADCRGVLALLKEILVLHQKYEARLCVSLPQMSGRILRRHYIKKDFPKPSRPLLAAGLLSYHGGKNAFPAHPGWYEDCYDLDINSAYAEAMSKLPDFERGRWKQGSGMSFFRDHPHGLYSVSGFLKDCPWGCLQSHDFRKAQGEIKKLWSTGYEIEEAVRSGEIRIDDIRGFGFHLGRSRNKADENKKSAFARYVDEFYSLRKATKDPALKFFYKQLLVSPYGKLIQRTENEDDEKVAGSMFDPGIASLVTGFVRAKIHRLEHKYRAIHTATDGFITQIKPDPADMGPDIGKLKCEWDYPGGKKGPAFGRVLILRNKLYLFYDQDGKLKKSGLHGFQGKADELEKIWKSSSRKYKITRLTTWGQAWHSGIPPGTEETVSRVLTLAR